MSFYLTLPQSKQAARLVNRPINLPAPVGGLNAVSSVMAMPPTDAVVLENWIPYPDRVQIRMGVSDYTTGFANTVYRMHNYAALTGGETIWATTDAGVYNATTAGAVGAAAIALTNGKTVGAILSTGANNYLTLVNGTDSMVQYDGATWSSIAAVAPTNTNTFSYVEVYRQRVFFVVKNSMTLVYLAANAASGGSTTYNTAALFRRGGYIVALGTWTIDGGTGPDDHLVIVTSQGEIAVFTGADPASWTYKGTYYVGRPLGTMPLFKYGGDLLYLCELGLFPLSKALLVASLDRTQAISQKISQTFADAGTAYFSNFGWQITSMPDIPLILVNVPGSTIRYQYAMHPATGAWSIFSGWEAQCFVRSGGSLYLGVGTKTAKVGGSSDYGGNITATMFQAYSNLGYARNKKIQEIRPVFETNGNFSYNMGVAADFQDIGQTNPVFGRTAGAAALWGTATWGSALWSGSNNIARSWRAVPDIYSTWKAFYLQVISNSVTLSYLGCDMLVTQGMSF